MSNCGKQAGGKNKTKMLSYKFREAGLIFDLI